MKKPHIIVVLIVAAVLIAVGVYGLTSSKEERSDNGRITGISSPAPAPRYDAQELMNVVIPEDMPSQIKDYEGFRVSFNRDNRTPNWVAWELLGSEAKGDVPRAKSFWTDSDVAGCPTTNDYKNSGYDRGHLCPAADQKWSVQAMQDCFSLAYFCPQNSSLNT